MKLRMNGTRNADSLRAGSELSLYVVKFTAGFGSGALSSRNILLIGLMNDFKTSWPADNIFVYKFENIMLSCGNF